MKIEIARGTDGRWIAKVPELPGVMVYGKTRKEVVSKVEALALRVVADRLDHGEAIHELDELSAVPAIGQSRDASLISGRKTYKLPQSASLFSRSMKAD